MGRPAGEWLRLVSAAVDRGLERGDAGLVVCDVGLEVSEAAVGADGLEGVEAVAEAGVRCGAGGSLAVDVALEGRVGGAASGCLGGDCCDASCLFGADRAGV